MVNAKNIIDAYLFLRSENHTIPSEVIEFMRGASLEKLELINKSVENRNQERRDND